MTTSAVPSATTCAQTGTPYFSAQGTTPGDGASQNAFGAVLARRVLGGGLVRDPLPTTVRSFEHTGHPTCSPRDASSRMQGCRPCPASPPSPGSPSAGARVGEEPTDDDATDPIHRHRASYAPPVAFPDRHATASGEAIALRHLSPVAPAPVRAVSSLEDLIPALVRRIAWSSHGRRGTARLEIGAGELTGATLLVHSDDGRVRVTLDVPTGVDASAWHARIVASLTARNIPHDDVEVR